ncbi:MAG: BrnT family toxin [Candidatus Omnitrophica bacterium]|nr:BrnT family toxin [Candidatus Omnitrophota bacterium]
MKSRGKIIFENHIAKHGVSVSEVEEAILFCKPFYQKSREGKYVAYAITEDGRYLFMRYLFIVFIIKDRGLIRVISTRDMDEKGRRYYKKRKGVK